MGEHRYARHREAGNPDGRADDCAHYPDHVGTVAELAFHLAYPHLAWTFHNGWRPGQPEPDFLPDIDIKACAPSLNLIVAHNDPREYRYVLAWVRFTGDIVFRGWMEGWRVQQDRYWCGWLNKPGWRVPWGHLRPMREMAEIQAPVVLT